MWSRVFVTLFFVTLFTFAAAVCAQAPVAPPPETILQFGTASDRMTVPVKIDGRGPYDFVIDTGAERSVLSREVSTVLGLGRGRPVRVFGFAGSATLPTVKIGALGVSTLATAAMEAPAVAGANLGAAGMLGLDALQGHRLSIDFRRRTMTLRPARGRALGDIVVPARYRAGQLIVSDAKFGGRPIAVVIDTGSPISVANRAMLALARSVPRTLGPISVVGVTGQTFDANYVTVDGLQLGGLGFDNVPLTFVDAPPFERLGLRDTPTLILGMSTLRLFRRVDMDFAHREIVFSLQRGPIRIGDVCATVMGCRRFVDR